MTDDSEPVSENPSPRRRGRGPGRSVRSSRNTGRGCGGWFSSGSTAGCKGRIDPSDVLQEAYLEVARSLADYLKNPQIPFYLWVRFITSRKLQALHRHHLGTQGRDAGREVSLHRGGLPQASSVSLAEQLLGRYATPSQAAVKAELQIRIQEALNEMDPIDREVLALRHFEELSNAETAQVLGIGEAAASQPVRPGRCGG